MEAMQVGHDQKRIQHKLCSEDLYRFVRKLGATDSGEIVKAQIKRASETLELPFHRTWRLWYRRAEPTGEEALRILEAVRGLERDEEDYENDKRRVIELLDGRGAGNAGKEASRTGGTLFEAQTQAHGRRQATRRDGEVEG